jgi:hypothetical protein
MTDPQISALLPIFILCIFGNIVGYWIKNIVQKNDYPTKYFSGHFKDTINIFKLAKSTSDKNIKAKYFALGIIDCLMGIAFIIFVVRLFLFVSSKGNIP